MVQTMDAAYWRHKLQLVSHIEGGSYREVYRSALQLPQQVLSTAHGGARNALTAIYFMLEYGEYSAFHRIASDELWHFHDGGQLTIYEIGADGSLAIHLLGLGDGAQPLVAIKAGSWFASRVEGQGRFALCSCTVAPGFDFADFELAVRTVLQQQYPQHAALITELTRQ